MVCSMTDDEIMRRALGYLSQALPLLREVNGLLNHLPAGVGCRDGTSAPHTAFLALDHAKMAHIVLSDCLNEARSYDRL